MDKVVEALKLLSKDNQNYWDFEKQNRKGVHKIASYPATMVANMQNEVIKCLVKEGDVQNMLDPFHGSGTSLVEGAKHGITPIGIDINPLASLITRVKLEGVDKKKAVSALRNIQNKITRNHEYSVHDFTNITKWFRNDIITDLSKLRTYIGEENSANVRRYLWVVIIDVIKKHSNTRSTTFKLHIKNNEMIKRTENKVFDMFFKRASIFLEEVPNFSRNARANLLLGDSISQLKKITSNSIDMICTSPPYGDNSTTVTYGQYSILPLLWIPTKDTGLKDEQLLSTFSAIDSSSLGGNLRRIPEEDIASLNSVICKIQEKKRKKVLAFVEDYRKVLIEIARVLKDDKYLAITLGNRRVDNVKIPLDEITTEILQKKGVKKIQTIERKILQKRMPVKVSSVNEKSVESMSTEFLMIFKKEN